MELVADEPKLRGILEGLFKKIYGADAAMVKQCVDQCVTTLQARATPQPRDPPCAWL